MKLLSVRLALGIAILLSVDTAYPHRTVAADGSMEGRYREADVFAGGLPPSGNPDGGRPSALAPLPRPWQEQGPWGGEETQAAQQIRAGYRIAKFVCRACHIVEPGQAAKPILLYPGRSFMDI